MKTTGKSSLLALQAHTCHIRNMDGNTAVAHTVAEHTLAVEHMVVHTPAAVPHTAAHNTAARILVQEQHTIAHKH